MNTYPIFNLFAGVEFAEAFDGHEHRWRRAFIERFAPYQGRAGWYIRWADKPRFEEWESRGGWNFQVRLPEPTPTHAAS